MTAKSVRKIAVVYDDTLRPETSGVYCRKALAELVAVEHFRPDQLERIDKDAYDLFLRIDDGLHYDLPDSMRPTAWWAIDTHLDFEKRLEAAFNYDFVFAAQKNGAARLRDGGVENARRLPLACDPQLHGKRNAEKRTDVCFVGNLFPGPREDLLALLQRTFPNTAVGRCYFEEMAETYSASRIVFNRSLADDVNMRVFEALAAGSLLLTNDLTDNGQSELFECARFNSGRSRCQIEAVWILSC